MLLELVRHLEAHGPAPSAFGHMVGDELSITPTNRYNRASVNVQVDWQDYGTIRDGLPELHDRLTIRRGRSPRSRDERTRELSRVEHLIWEAFGWAAPPAGEPIF